MGLYNNLKGYVNRALSNTRSAEVLGTGVFEDNKRAMNTEWFFNPNFGIPRGVDIGTLRGFGITPWVRMAVDTIIEEFVNLEWDIIPKEEHEDSFNEDTKNELVEFFKLPNKDEDFITFIKKLLEDILILDAGVVVKTFSKEDYALKNINIKNNSTKRYNTFEVKTLIDVYSEYNVEQVEPSSNKSKLLEIRAADGGSFLIQPDIYGRLPEQNPSYFQYSFMHPQGKPIPFFKREIVYFRMNPRSNSIYGFSPIQSMFNVIEAQTNATRFNQMMFENAAVPSLWMNFPDMDDKQVNKFRSAWGTEVKGKFNKTVITNMKQGAADVKPLNMNATDMQWLDGQKFYMKVIFALYHINQGELGFTEDVNRSNGEVQAKLAARKAIIPLARLIESKFNNGVVPEFYDNEIECDFKFLIDDAERDKETLQLDLQLVREGILTPNEFRLERGLDPVEGGDELKAKQQPSFGFNQDEKPKVKETKKALVLKKKDEITPGEDMESESDEYDVFLSKYYTQLEKQTLRAVNVLNPLVSKNLKKDFGSFFRALKALFDVENIKPQLNKLVKRSFNNGIDSAETQLNMQVGFVERFNFYVKELTEEQVNGYVLPDGKQWFGIQGVNETLTQKIHNSITEGLEKGEGLNALKSRVQDLFSVAKDSTALRIARTESTRITNSGSNNAYAESGLTGKKEWVSAMDHRTSDVCKRLHGQRVDIRETFTDKVSGKDYHFPPALPNCRSVILFVPDEVA